MVNTVEKNKAWEWEFVTAVVIREASLKEVRKRSMRASRGKALQGDGMQEQRR